jgi:S1-C subfamily serine protease
MSDPAGEEGAFERDESSGGPRPDPLDRPWVHPSELHSFVENPLPPVKTRPREWVIGVVSAAVGVAATLLLLVAFGAIGERHRSPITPPVLTNASRSAVYSDAVRVYEEVSPSIVALRATSGDTTTLGSAVAVKSDRVMTSAHLVINASSIVVITSDQRTFTAKLVGADADTDLALLDVSGADLPFQPLSTREPQLGDPVVAVALPKGRSFLGMNVIQHQNMLVDTPAGTAIAGLLESGIKASPETSGGGMFDPDGQLVGILAAPPGGPNPSGLSVPITVADDVRRQIESSGKVAHGWLGVAGADNEDPFGAKITEILPDSPAVEKLAPGDVVTRAGGRAVTTYADLMAAWRRRVPGDSLVVVFQRGRSEHTVNVPLTDERGTPPAPPPTSDTDAAPSSADN